MSIWSIAKSQVIPKDPFYENQKLHEIIENNTIEYTLEFKTPEDLLKNFDLLEEKNLFLIQQTQEAEQAIDDKNQEFLAVRRKMNKEYQKVSRGI